MSNNIMKDAETRANGIIFIVVVTLFISFLINVYLGFATIGFGIWLIVRHLKKENEKKQADEEASRIRVKQLDEYAAKYGIRCRYSWQYYYGGHPEIDKHSNVFGEAFHVWADNENLYFVSHFDVEDVGKVIIPIDNIVYYHREGEVYNEITIEGGGGGGASLSGAVIGGIIAGDAGAIIGSRKPVESITSSNTLVDKRKTIIEYYINKKLNIIKLDSDAYEHLVNDIPQKEMQYVMYLNGLNNRNNDFIDVTDQIKKLSELKEQGILTEEEFNDKKKILLDKIG